MKKRINPYARNKKIKLQKGGSPPPGNSVKGGKCGGAHPKEEGAVGGSGEMEKVEEFGTSPQRPNESRPRGGCTGKEPRSWT